jgi:hypothetical protein
VSTLSDSPRRPAPHGTVTPSSRPSASPKAPASTSHAAARSRNPRRRHHQHPGRRMALARLRTRPLHDPPVRHRSRPRDERPEANWGRARHRRGVPPALTLSGAPFRLRSQRRHRHDRRPQTSRSARSAPIGLDAFSAYRQCRTADIARQAMHSANYSALRENDALLRRIADSRRLMSVRLAGEGKRRSAGSVVPQRRRSAWCGAGWAASRSVSTPDRSLDLSCCRPGRDLGRPGLAMPS